jgi:hypothetical protein
MRMIRITLGPGLRVGVIVRFDQIPGGREGKKGALPSSCPVELFSAAWQDGSSSSGAAGRFGAWAAAFQIEPDVTIC